MTTIACARGSKGPSARDLAAVEQMRSDLSMPLSYKQTSWLRIMRLDEAGQLTKDDRQRLCTCPSEHCVVHGRMPAADSV